MRHDKTTRKVTFRRLVALALCLAIGGAGSVGARDILSSDTYKSGTTLRIDSGATLRVEAGATLNVTGAAIAGLELTDLSSRNFSDLQNIPTTVAGYGITDALKTTGSLSELATRNFGDLQNIPSTVDGFGIADAAKKTTGLSQFPGGSYAFRDLTALATESVDRSIADRSLGEGAQNRFSATHIANMIDLSCVSVSTSDPDSRKKATLISPRHVVLSHHFYPAHGSQIEFVGSVTRTLVNSERIGSTDLRIGILDSDVPATVGFARVLTPAQEAVLFKTTSTRVPAFYLRQNHWVYVADSFAKTGASSYFHYYTPADPTRSAFYFQPVAGDSSHPVFLAADHAVLLGAIESSAAGTGAGPSVTTNFAAINAAMTSLGGGYQLTPLPITIAGTSAGRDAAVLASAGQIPVVDSDGKLHNSVLPTIINETIGLQTVGNANATIANGTRQVIRTEALTFSRGYTMPAASSYEPGTGFTFNDFNNADGTAFTTWTAQFGIGDSFGTSSHFYMPPLPAGGGSFEFISDGVSTWNVRGFGIVARRRDRPASGNAGTIDLSGGTATVAHSGSINLSGGHTNIGSSGGSINTSAAAHSGGSINTSGGATAAGGSITTSNGGGSINTTGTGSIQLGVSATRTTLTGTATAARSIAFPNWSGTAAVFVSPPASASSTCTEGQISADADYFYRCVATDTWKRAAMSTWP